MISAGGFGTCSIPRLDSSHSLTLTICSWSLPTSSRIETANFLLWSYHLLSISDLLVQVSTSKRTYPCSARICACPGKSSLLTTAYSQGHRRQYYLKSWKKSGFLRPNLYSILLEFWGSTYLVRLEGWNSIWITPRLREQYSPVHLLTTNLWFRVFCFCFCFLQIPNNT